MAFFQRTDGSGVLLLSPSDNIAVATAELPEGTERSVAGLSVNSPRHCRPVPSCHEPGSALERTVQGTGDAEFVKKSPLRGGQAP